MPDAATKGELLAYVKTSEVKLVRKKHRIGFRTQTTLKELIGKLEQVPSWAIIEEVELHDDCITTIEFYEEVRVDNNGEDDHA